jgi:hypothetical protein
MTMANVAGLHPSHHFARNSSRRLWNYRHWLEQHHPRIRVHCENARESRSNGSPQNHFLNRRSLSSSSFKRLRSPSSLDAEELLARTHDRPGSVLTTITSGQDGSLDRYNIDWTVSLSTLD